MSPLFSIDANAKVRVAAAYGQLPLAFEQNQGQTAEDVKFVSRGAGYTLFLTSADAVLALRNTSHKGHPAEAVLRMKLRGGSPASQVTGRDELPGRTNYLIGRDPEKWRRGIARFEKVEYENVYPGVNLVYYGNQRQLEYDFIVSPGADPQRIRLAFEGVQTRRIDDRGDLVLETRTDPVRLQKPVIYQEIDGRRQQVAGGYLLQDSGDVAFQVGSYDTTRPLIIDPVLVYSTYLGGNGYDFALDIAVDATGSAYVVGNTLSSDFPVNNAVPHSCTPIESPACDDIFVTKLSPDGTAIEYSTYIGGTNTDVGNGIAVDGSGNVYVTGTTWSVDFPTVSAIQPDFRSNPAYLTEAFVAKLGSSGAELVYSTYLGGHGEDRGSAIAVDGQGSAYVTGGTSSFDFPTVTPLQSAPEGSLDAFVAKLMPDGSALAYSTFLGGQSYDIANDIALSDEGFASITGETGSVDFPMVNASQPSLPPFPPIVLSGSAEAVTGPTPAAPLAPGVYTIVLTVNDGRGGVASDTVVVTVRDTTPPVFTGVPAPITVEQSSPLGTVVTVPLPTATDNCPGPLFVSSDASSFSPPQPSIFPPGMTTVTFRTCDASCNRATATTTVTVVDTTRPGVTVVSPQARTYLHSDVLPISFSASDTGSGLAPGSPGAALDGIAVPNGHSVGLLALALGPHSLVVSAVDQAGNTASHPIAFQVIATVGSLLTTVNAFIADGRINDSNTANGLLAKLNETRDAIDKGKNGVGVNKLREFIDQVNGRAGRSIAPDAAQLLVTDAQYVIGRLQ